MQALLSQLNSVPGVIGSLVCDDDGRLVAQAFPPTFDASRVHDAAALLSDRTAALEGAMGTVGLIDLRYAGARIVVKSMEGARLLFLCAPSINLQLLTMSAAGAVRRIEKLTGERARPRAPGGGRLHAMVQRINALIERSDHDHFKLRGQIVLKAGVSLDLVDADTPDDPATLEKLKAAASAVLGQPV